MRELVLRTEEIFKSFTGTQALKGVSIELRKGEVHAIVGENGAGKSTLMNIISGGLKSDSGKIFVDGKEVSFDNSKEAQMMGIGLVHQELALFSELTVAENIYVERMPNRKGIINSSELEELTLKAISEFGVSINPSDLIEDLKVSHKQIVEIAKVISMNCKVVIFDEPTSSLNEQEAQLLFKIIGKLKEQEVGIIYISHKLSEIFEICDRITILRDGTYIDTYDVATTDSEHIVHQMIGRKLDSFYPEKSNKVTGEKLLEVVDFSCGKVFENITFSTYKGEIVGLCGLVGSGRTEIARAICQIDKSESGKLYLGGKEVTGKEYADIQKAGICYLSEDRKEDGLFLQMSVAENLVAPQLDIVSDRGLINFGRINDIVKNSKEKLKIKFSNPDQFVSSLSGGNQQKIMISKLLELNPKIIIMDEPTRGIDVGSKSEIHTVLRELSDKGIGIIVISSEMPEVVGICDRVVIINEGRVVGELAGDDVTQDKIIQRLSMFKKEVEKN